ncbi:Crp/Fnr family transcriptional regulator [Benzoatithermus flavus]|uniref:Crp/Fnr family transcriptional regulator n=1 Tax=Benzoatithermus flavus TaxID=3108223 RepID=A0ABU8XTW2_9PROT
MTASTAPAATLDGIGLLAPLEPAERKMLAARCAWRRYRAGERILSRDSSCRHVLFIVEGAVRVVNYAASGREVAYARIGAGHHVGELSAIDGEPRSASVEAETDCLVASLPASAFHELLLAHGAITLALLRDLARMVRRADERITELTVLGAMQRVYRELQRLARPSPEGLKVTPLPTQESLAAHVGTTRETVARAFGQLIRSGIVGRSGRDLVIRNAAMLDTLIGAEA